jgi:hypothetical protein
MQVMRLARLGTPGLGYSNRVPAHEDPPTPTHLRPIIQQTMSPKRVLCSLNGAQPGSGTRAECELSCRTRAGASARIFAFKTTEFHH